MLMQTLKLSKRKPIIISTSSLFAGEPLLPERRNIQDPLRVSSEPACSGVTFKFSTFLREAWKECHSGSSGPFVPLSRKCPAVSLSECKLQGRAQVLLIVMFVTVPDSLLWCRRVSQGSQGAGSVPGETAVPVAGTTGRVGVPGPETDWTPLMD